MKIMLIIPPITLEKRYGRLKDVGTLYPPLGLAYLAAMAEKMSCEVKIIDSEAEGYTYSNIEKQIEDFKPDLVGMQTYCTNIQQCNKVANIVKKHSKKIKVVLGGAQVTIFPEESVKKENIDFVIVGEGEIVFEELIKTLKNNNSDFREVNGLVWKKKKKIIMNSKQELIKNLDSIPIPARHLFPIKKYHSSAQLRGKRTLNIMTSRGCPYRCAYCSGHISFGKTFRFFSPNRVIEEIISMIKDFKIDSIQFYDETFTVNRERVFDLCNALIKNNIKLPWACFTRVNLVDEELLKKMKEGGCYQIFFGVESGNQRLLDLIKKDITIEQAKNAIKLCKKVGIETFCSFMLNLPDETLEESWKTINFAIELDPDFVQFPITTPFPGTELYRIAKENGYFITEDWSKFMSWDEIVYVSKGRSVEEIKKTVKQAYKKFYMRPNYIFKSINRLRKLPPSKIINLTKAGIKIFFMKK